MSERLWKFKLVLFADLLELLLVLIEGNASYAIYKTIVRFLDIDYMIAIINKVYE